MLAFAAIGMITVTTFVFGPLVSVGWRFHALVDETPDRDLVDSLLREPSFESVCTVLISACMTKVPLSWLVAQLFWLCCMCVRTDS